MYRKLNYFPTPAFFRLIKIWPELPILLIDDKDAWLTINMIQIKLLFTNDDTNQYPEISGGNPE
jgi:hypothetical protein